MRYSLFQKYKKATNNNPCAIAYSKNTINKPIYSVRYALRIVYFKSIINNVNNAYVLTMGIVRIKT